MRIDTAAGTIRGTVVNGVARFAGIPFAERLTRADRFAPARPAAPWAGEFAALTPGPAPPQPPVFGLGMRGATRTSEDCLTLNIFAPAQRGMPRAVLVWIFGGGFIYGDGADPLFDGSNLARQQDLVVVTINYRLGLWGFAPLQASNVGLGDQVTALRWVSAHIGAFGGDPANVTVVGESAGAMSVCNLLACPPARGLFHRAIAQSGAAENVASAAQADETAATLRNALACRAEDADMESLLEAQRITGDRLRPHHHAWPFRPYVDSDWLPERPLEAAARGASIPLIIGMNKHEQRLYVRPSLKLTDDELAQWVARRLTASGTTDVPVATLQVLDYYRRAPAHPRYADAAMLADIETELRFRRPLLRYVKQRGGNTWVYQFDRPSPAMRGWLGAAHAIEIPFVFGNFDLPATAKFVGVDANALELSRQMMKLWGHFARHGTAPAEWPAYSQATPTQLHLDTQIACRRVDADPAVAMWNGILPV